jgi:hypothetical protein
MRVSERSATPCNDVLQRGYRNCGFRAQPLGLPRNDDGERRLVGQITSLNQNPLSAYVKPSREKYSTSVFRNFMIVCAGPASAGGAYRDRHGRGKRDAVDVRMLSVSCADESIPHVRRNRAVPIPRRWDQALRDERAATVAKKPGAPRRTRISRKATRAGNAGCSGCPVVACVRKSAPSSARKALRVRPASGVPRAL